MSDRSKKRLANFLMEELLDRLQERADIKAMLGELSGLPIDELLQQLLDEFAHVLEKRYVEYARSLQDQPHEESAPPPRKDVSLPASPASEPKPPVTSAEGRAPVSERSLIQSVKEEAPEEGDRPVPAEAPVLDAEAPTTRRELRDSDLHGTVRAEPEQQSEVLGEKEGEVKEPGEAAPSGSEIEVEQPQVTEDEEPEISERQRVLFEGVTQEKLPCEFTDDDAVYLHAVALLRPGETEEPKPFLLEEKGIGGKDFAFALDHRGLRFHLSKVNMSEVSLTKGGLLLHGKQESLHMQGAHENIVNELRAHGTLLPFVPGTVARSKEEFYNRIDEHLDALKSALLELSVTKWWTLTLSVLDSRIAHLVGTTKPVAERDLGAKRRSSSSIPAARTYDIKLLEKMLQKEKKIAQAVHEQLEAIADRTDTDFIIGIGGGSTEDWKPILKASYEVKHVRLPAFYRKVTDLQYQYMLFDLMFCLQGNREGYSFAEA